MIIDEHSKTKAENFMSYLTKALAIGVSLGFIAVSHVESTLRPLKSAGMCRSKESSV